MKEAVKIAHPEDALILSAIRTSQESSDPETIRYMAIQNKICGVDIQHIGDAGYGRLAPVENIFENEQSHSWSSPHYFDDSPFNNSLKIKDMC